MNRQIEKLVNGNIAATIPIRLKYDGHKTVIIQPEKADAELCEEEMSPLQKVKKALAAGKFVFSEKPIAVTEAEIEILKELVKHYPGKLFFRQNRRFEPAFRHVLEIIKSGTLGNVFEIKLARHSFSYREDWQTFRDCGGGQLNNWGPHIIDHALQLLESPVKRLYSKLFRVAALGDAEDTVKAVFEGENGRIVDIEISGGVALKSPIYAVYGTRGSIVLDDEETIRMKVLAPGYKVPTHSASRDVPDVNSPFSGSIKIDWNTTTIPVKKYMPEFPQAIYSYLYQAIRSGVDFPIKTEEAFEVAKWIFAIRAQNS